MFGGGPLGSGPAPVPVRSPRPRRPLPSRAVLAIGSLALTCLTLLAALVLATTSPTARASAAEAHPSEASPVPADAAREAETDAEADAPTAASEAGAPAGEPAVIPADLLARLEAASDAPLPTELGLFLEAVQLGFGSESAQLEPALRSYAYRLASRFEWNPDHFQIAVTAPDPALAEARSALLGRLFAAAVASGRLTLRAGAGAHALTLVTE